MRLSTPKLVAALAALACAAAACEKSVLEPGQKAPNDARANICADCEGGGGGGGGGGGTPVDPFNPPASPVGGVNVPVDYYGITNPAVVSSCQQNPHVWVAFSNDVAQGTVLYPNGVVVKNTKAKFYFYNSAGQLAKIWLTQPARDNCVIHYEPEAMSTWDMAPGYYYIYANFFTLPYPIQQGAEPVQGYPTEHGTVYLGPMRIR